MEERAAAPRVGAASARPRLGRGDLRQHRQPLPDYNGFARGRRPTPFTCSIVAPDAMTGKYKWHYQAVHHDLWDLDMPTPIILFDQVYNGQMRKALAAHSKQGWVYILDRITGKPILEIDEKPVPQEPRQKTAATQPVPTGDPTAPQCAEPVPDYERGCMFTPVWTDTKIAQPSAAGDWAPGAFDPQSGYLFFTTGVSTRQVQYDRKGGRPCTRSAGWSRRSIRGRTNRYGRRKYPIWQASAAAFLPLAAGCSSTAARMDISGVRFPDR